jgi:hypothetical protein
MTTVTPSLVFTATSSKTPAATPTPTPTPTPTQTQAPAQGARTVRVTEVNAKGAAGRTRTVSVPVDRSTTVSLSSTTAGVIIEVQETAGAAPVYAALVLRAVDALGPMIAVAPVIPSTPAASTPSRVQADYSVGVASGAGQVSSS